LLRCRLQPTRRRTIANKKFVVELERARLEGLIAKGKAAAKVILKACILLKADQGRHGQGWSDERICKALEANISMMTRVRAKLVTEGLDAVLTRKQHSTPPIEPIFDSEKQAQLIALACSEPPSGHALVPAPAAIRDWIDARNADPRPFQWIAEASAILQKTPPRQTGSGDDHQGCK
jgi:hypothetical protein